MNGPALDHMDATRRLPATCAMWDQREASLTHRCNRPRSGPGADQLAFASETWFLLEPEVGCLKSTLCFRHPPAEVTIRDAGGTPWRCSASAAGVPDQSRTRFGLAITQDRRRDEIVQADGIQIAAHSALPVRAGVAPTPLVGHRAVSADRRNRTAHMNRRCLAWPGSPESQQRCCSWPTPQGNSLRRPLGTVLSSSGSLAAMYPK